ncbi:head completion/stabilization protein [Basfia succiniciproducens]|uniref:head completion/stabilization protein n=1 Tax=Basfia succiniciproducens TaxID=653940 RepID=UPI003FCE9BAB
MKDGSISVKLAPNLQMDYLQSQVDAQETTADIITNDGFYPDISISDYRNQSRLDGTVTTARVKDALIEAIATVNDELADFKTSANSTALEHLPSTVINGESLLVYRYKRAVHCLATANLYERYASYDTTADGEKKMDMLQESINQLRRDARFAITDILAKNRINVELL